MYVALCITRKTESLSFYIVAYSRSGAREIVRFIHTLLKISYFLKKTESIILQRSSEGREVSSFDVPSLIAHELDRFFVR